MSFDIEKCLEKAHKGDKLDEIALRLICIKMKEIFIEEDNIVTTSAPVTCVGDTHGYEFIKFANNNFCIYINIFQLYFRQFLDFQEIFRIGGPVPYTNYVFLGDYVDRGRLFLNF